MPKNTNFNREVIESLIEDTISLTDAERLEETANLIIRTENPDIKVFNLEILPNIDNIRLQCYLKNYIIRNMAYIMKVLSMARKKPHLINFLFLKEQLESVKEVPQEKTVSTQTIKTQSKNAMKSQTYEMRSKIQQTMNDNYSNVPKPSNFIYGLRGRKDKEQFIIDLTRPVEE
ncbi:hypothetical protein NQ314_011656 [Rhamnusium bicolor]|uniref:Uncharacterized protein n=1 Tax=Rhamnusium bicolor TaxID=1586634 RepID=A0AAV8XHK0_9CUCU|nr:hypothetical protein NQ314_011656 [Rhamnusium bicolor]